MHLLRVQPRGSARLWQRDGRAGAAARGARDRGRLRRRERRPDGAARGHGPGCGRRGDRRDPGGARGQGDLAPRPERAARRRLDARAQGADGGALGGIHRAAGRLRHAGGAVRGLHLGAAGPAPQALCAAERGRLLRRPDDVPRPRRRGALPARRAPGDAAVRGHAGRRAGGTGALRAAGRRQVDRPRLADVSGRRAFVVVLDACGVGALPDAADYGDAGSNTLAHLAEAVGGLDLPVLQRLGLGSIIPIEGVAPADDPVVHGRLHPIGPGKESTTGHWELMGVVPQHPLPTYPEGFPPDVVAVVEEATGLRFCCNRPYSGTEVLDDYGPHHLETGEVILYTSADSVLQLAAHVDVLDEPALYDACEAARAVMTGEHAVGRVIARPFDGEPGAFHRREGRRDYAVEPPGRSYLQELQADGVPVHAVGKIRDLFAGVGIDVKHTAATNETGIAATTKLVRS